MKEQIEKIKENFIIRKAERDLIQKDINSCREKLNIHKKKHEDAIQARELLQTVAENTQKKLEVHISNIVTSALHSVFDDPYDFVSRFVKRRNKTECDLLFIKDGEEFKPIESSGGGALDIASIALRIAFWSLGKTAPTIVLDEPGKFVSNDLQYKVSSMLKTISDKLGIQFIIISHQPDMIDSADKIFKIHNGGLLNE